MVTSEHADARKGEDDAKLHDAVSSPASGSMARQYAGPDNAEGLKRLVSLLVFLILGAAVAALMVLAMAPISVIKRLHLVITWSLGPLYLAIVAVHAGHRLAGAHIGVVTRPIRIELPDKQVYRILDGGPAAHSALVLTEDSGAFAKFARAQRAVAALEESLPLFLTLLLAAGFVLPWLSLVLGSLFSISRAWEAVECADGAPVTKCCLARPYQLPISLASEGICAGVCLFLGLMATTHDFIGPPGAVA